MSGPSNVARIRNGLASFLAFSAGLYAFTPLGKESFHWFLLIPVLGLLTGAVAIQVSRLDAQLLARAVWWSNLGLGVTLCVLGNIREREAGIAVAITCGLALLVAGKGTPREAEARARFMPAALRSSLLLLLVLALADAQTFALFGAASLDRTVAGVVFLVAAAALLGGFVLLLRLSFAGLLVNVGACALLLVFALLGSANIKGSLRAVTAVLCAVHLACASPALLSFASKRPLPSLGPRARDVATTIAVVGMVAAAVIVFFSRGGRHY